MEEIIVDIPPNPADGITIEVNGVKGKACTKLTEELESALGKTTSSKKKAEYRQASTKARRSQNQER